MFWNNLRNRHFFVLDVVLLLFTPALALTLRDDLTPSGTYALPLLWLTVLALLVKLPLFYFFGLYNRYWRYASVDDMLTILTSVFLATVVVTGAFFAAQAFGLLFGNGFPRSVPFLDGLLTLLVVSGTRFSARAVEDRRARITTPPNRQKVLIVGAGNSGAMIARDIQSNPYYHLELVGFVDDATEKQNLHIHGARVLGPLTQLPALLQEAVAQEVIIAMPSASGKVIREIVQICKDAGVTAKILPGMHELLSGQVRVNRLRNVEIEDLLRREPVAVDLTALRQIFAGRRVLVTGAGGSIGVELCRQIAAGLPAQLIALGHGENSLFTLAQELKRLQSNTPFRFDMVVADIRDHQRLEHIFQRYQPHIIFHAAAHKHVPLMEDNLTDAITNNILGTRNLLNLAEAYHTERFVLISSDKAVNPTSVMGVTKRVTELMVAATQPQANQAFMVVRFGNVLGSRGSVVPLFRQQIAEGEPITITHPDIDRYFMTIPEAVQLVLQAEALGTGGEIFVLDMGQPVKLVDLAHDLVKLSGLQIGRDIDIIYTGLRPGEKLHEELFSQHERVTRTRHAKIFMARSETMSLLHGAALQNTLDALITAAQRGQEEECRRILGSIVPEYTPPTSPTPPFGLSFNLPPAVPISVTSGALPPPTLPQ